MCPFEQEDIHEDRDDKYEVKVACTMNRFAEMQNAIDTMNPLVCIRLGGSGNKGI